MSTAAADQFDTDIISVNFINLNIYHLQLIIPLLFNGKSYFVLVSTDSRLQYPVQNLLGRR